MVSIIEGKPEELRHNAKVGRRKHLGRRSTQPIPGTHKIYYTDRPRRAKMDYESHGRNQKAPTMANPSVRAEV